MMPLVSGRKRAVSIILKIIVILAATIGTILSAVSAMGGFMSGGAVFMYFTIQSNIGVALISLAELILLLRGKPVGNAWYVIQYVGAVSITLTGAVFTFMLAPTLGDQAWTLRNVLTHVVVPIAFIVDFFLTAVYGALRKGHIWLVVLPPGAYAVFASIGYVAGWEFRKGGIHYPYFFLNWGSPAGAFGFCDQLPFMGCVWWILALLALILLVGALYLWIVNKCKRRMQAE